MEIGKRVGAALKQTTDTWCEILHKLLNKKKTVLILNISCYVVESVQTDTQRAVFGRLCFMCSFNWRCEKKWGSTKLRNSIRLAYEGQVRKCHTSTRVIWGTFGDTESRLFNVKHVNFTYADAKPLYIGKHILKIQTGLLAPDQHFLLYLRRKISLGFFSNWFRVSKRHLPTIPVLCDPNIERSISRL